MKTLLIIAGLLFSVDAISQTAEKSSVVIGSMTDKPNALLVVNPENGDQGVLMPQLSTSQRLALKPSSPSEDGVDLEKYTYRVIVTFDIDPCPWCRSTKAATRKQPNSI